MSDNFLSTTRNEVTLTQLERAARVYRTNTDAYQALGITRRAFVRLCRMHKVETPAERMKRLR